MHILCTICSDLLNNAECIFVTNCGHIFHHNCLGQWIDRSETCPQCRNKATHSTIIRLYPTRPNDVVISEDVATLQSQLDDVQLQLREVKADSKEKDNQITKLTKDLEKYVKKIQASEAKNASHKTTISLLNEQIEYLMTQNKEKEKLQKENKSLKEYLKLLEGLDKILNGTSEDVEEMVQSYSDVQTLATFATSLKRGLCESEAKWKEAVAKLHTAKQKISAENNTVAELQAQLADRETKLATLKRKYKAIIKKKADNKSNNKKGDEVISDPQPEVKKTRASESSGESNSNGNDSLNTMVNRIENADSPYLNLKQGNIAISALLRNVVDKTKPSQLAIDNLERKTATIQNENIPKNGQNSLSIFKRKKHICLSLETEAKKKPEQLDVSYDGLGGHSKMDTFPVPNQTTTKSFIPKRTAKHRLQRPPQPGGNLDIGQMLKKFKHN